MTNILTIIDTVENDNCIAFSGTSIAIDDLFHEFVKIYPYDYVLHDGPGSCTGYFILTTSAKKLVDAMKLQVDKF